jgi:tRNA uridine 5-carbamoylmethylation protein Kti12
VSSLPPFTAVPTLYVTTGLPGCGKTRWAKMYVKAMKALGLRIARVGRDELRDALHHGCTDEELTEEAVTLAQHAAVHALLAAGWDVICDDGALVPGRFEGLQEVAASAGAQVVQVDFTRIGVDECKRRNALRPERDGTHAGRRVPDDMIHNLAALLPADRRPA